MSSGRSVHMTSASAVTPRAGSTSWADLIATHISRHHTTEAVRSEDGFSGQLTAWHYGNLRFVLSRVRGASVRGIQPSEETTSNLRDVWLCLCLDGSFEIDVDRHSTIVDPDRLAIMSCGRPHVVTFSPDCDVLWIRAPRRHFGSIRRDTGFIVLDAAAGVGRLSCQLLYGLQEQAHRLDEHDAGQIIRSTFGLVSTAIRASDRRLSLPDPGTLLDLGTVKRFVGDNLHDESFCLETAATRLGRNPRTLNKLFEAEGDSFMRWTWNRRLDRARAMLNEADCSITEVAFSCGFKNLSHFSRAFRGRFGIAPSSAAGLRGRNRGPH